MDGKAAKRQRARRAMTLLEILVAMGVAVVLFGIALGVMLSTNRVADGVIRRDSLLQYAQVSMKQIRVVIEAAVWPEDLAGVQPGRSQVAFANDALVFYSSHEPTSAGRFCVYSLGYQTTVGEEKPPEPGFFRLVPGETQPPRFTKLGGPYEASIEFRYATEFGRDLQPVWQESLDAGQRPRLIWVQLTVRDPERRNERGETAQVQLQTAIAL